MQLFTLLFLNTPRVEAKRFIDNGDHYIIEAEWIDRANIKITKFEFTDDQWISDEAKDAGGRGFVNQKLAEFVVGKIASAEDISPTVGNKNAFFMAPLPGCDASKERIKFNIDDGENLDDFNNVEVNDVELFDQNFWLPAEVGQRKCVHPLVGSTTLGRNDGNNNVLLFHPNKFENASIWFRQKTNDLTTLLRVDKKEGDFKKTGNPRVFAGPGVGSCPNYVELKVDIVPGINDAKYKHCRGDAGGGITDPAKVFIDDKDGADKPAKVSVPDNCESKNFGVLNWLLCGALDAADKTITGLSDAANELLNINNQYYNSKELKQTWSYFKNLATFLLIVVGLAMVVGQAVNKE